MTRPRRFLVLLAAAWITVFSTSLLSPVAVAADQAQRPQQRGKGPLRLELDGNSLSWDQLAGVLDADAVEVRLGLKARQAMTDSRNGAVAAVEAGQRVYGWNQALGPLKDEPLQEKDRVEFQRRVLRSHAAGVGPALSDRVARLALILRANTMARGAMGVRPEFVDRITALVNAGVTPVMPEIGSLGTGDLQPMAAAGLVLTGEPAPARFEGREAPAPEILAAAGLPRSFQLEQGEALPLISGGSVLTARYVDAVVRGERLVDAYDAAFALFLEATRAEQGAFDPRTHEERRIPAEVDAARRTRALICGTGWMTPEGRRRLGEESARIQDAVSVRANPHIVGALRQTLADARGHIEREANASTSNPLVFPKAGGGYEFVMGGNWDAALLGHEIDALNAQVADLGVLSQELSGRLLADKWSYHLPANLAGGQVGLNSGMVQVQTVAVALVPEMQVRALPAGTLSRPAKFGQEDHNTMAMASVRGLHDNLDRLETVLAVHVMMAAQGIDLIKDKMTGLPLGTGTSRVHAAVRRHVPALGDDRYMTPDVEKSIALVRSSELSRVVHAATAPADNKCAA
ncbi:histidine ammonia-lyase [Kibdelosporangium persicum]|uniref:Phenylalanine and histidine ammonia-lyase n=1 Tax=Kibdelosporangium persicum TaxID=2698649 RepID=A0ABX2FG31_9PSEU|nr:aromatic amino acid ammonia-lyase [Kibdelosporangium persicum]NRN70344.1 Phenylalanine and histidine ammonia-lyase [Kibdelosporangium persicum]